ncbi:MAG TPA: hypothetical protein VFL07_09420, partial [Rudaea sp.]|nr:hypothetical protein [Rudaea sp.]
MAHRSAFEDVPAVGQATPPFMLFHKSTKQKRPIGPFRWIRNAQAAECSIVFAPMSSWLLRLGLAWA